MNIIQFSEKANQHKEKHKDDETNYIINYKIIPQLRRLNKRQLTIMCGLIEGYIENNEAQNIK